MNTIHSTSWDDKTKQMMLYICHRASSIKKFGSIHLNKAFWFADILHYLKTRRSISNFKYIKQDMGPTPDPSQFLALRSALIQSNAIRYEEVEYLGRIQKRCVAVEETDLSLLTADEVAIIEKVLDFVKDMSAKEVSELTHKDLGWQIAYPREEIPFYTYILTMAEPKQSDLDWGLKYADEHRAKSHN